MSVNVRTHLPYNRELLRDLQRHGIEARQIHSGLMAIALPVVGGLNDCLLAGLTPEEVQSDTSSNPDPLLTPQRFRLVAGCHDRRYLRLYGGEQGGWNGNFGFARIICATNGTPLKPFVVSGNSDRWHPYFCTARFNTDRALVEVIATTPTPDRYSDVKIVRHEIGVEDDLVVVDPQLLWQGRHFELTYDCTDPTVDRVPLSVFIDAVTAAHQKARCPRCEEPHYCNGAPCHVRQR